jgi:hypothetical protein
MANMASAAYAVEGSKESLGEILGAIILAKDDTKNYTEYAACRRLGFSEKELEDYRLGGDIDDDPEIDDKGVLKFYAEEMWGLQDFHILLKKRFPDITVYWPVEEPGCELYCTNDEAGKYFPERYYADTCIDGIYNSEYFSTEEDLFKWLAKLTNNKVKSAQDIDEFNSAFEELGNEDDNFIHVYEYDISTE